VMLNAYKSGVFDARAMHGEWHIISGHFFYIFKQIVVEVLKCFGSPTNPFLSLGLVNFHVSPIIHLPPTEIPLFYTSPR
jgi:hypothetical protein